MKTNNNQLFLRVLIIFLLYMTACSPAVQPDTPLTATAFNDTRQNVPEQPTATPKSATITPLPTRITPTVYPPEEPGGDWLTYVHPDLNISIQYPPAWQVVNPGELAAPMVP